MLDARLHHENIHGGILPDEYKTDVAAAEKKLQASHTTLDNLMYGKKTRERPDKGKKNKRKRKKRKPNPKPQPEPEVLEQSDEKSDP